MKDKIEYLCEYDYIYNNETKHETINIKDTTSTRAISKAVNQVLNKTVLYDGLEIKNIMVYRKEE